MYQKVVKRILDFVISLITLPFLLLITIVLAPIIYFDDKGPVFYVSERAGKDGKQFNMLKFRSMKVNSPNLLNADGSTYNSPNDDRQTKVGKLIRKLSIDELPQIFNILKGEMSWIGPRPVLMSQAETFTDEERGKFNVLPGVTGYNQAFNRNQLSSHEERMSDAWYAENMSFILDVRIFFKTIDTVLHPDRVYRNTDTEEAISTEGKNG